MHLWWQVPGLRSNWRRWSALLYAIEAGHVDVVRALLEAGAGAKDDNLPLAWVAMTRRHDVIEIA